MDGDAEVMQDLEIREPTRSDLPLVRALYRSVKGRVRPERYDEWRFFDTPWGDSPALVALKDGACMALYLTWPAALSIGGETVLGVQIMDVMTHPDLRRRGLFVHLAHGANAIAMERGFEIGYGFPNEVSLPLFVRFINGDHAGDVSSWSADFRARGRWWERRRTWPEPGLRGTELDPTRPEPDELETLVAELHADPEICWVAKTAAYLDWRYSDASGERYDWLSLRTPAGELLAVGLVGERDEAWGGDFAGVARMHELFARTEEQAEVLLRFAAARAARRGALKVQILVKDPVVAAVLPRAGLRPEGSVPFLVRKFTGRLLAGNVHHFPFWRIISGDMDFY